VTEERDSMLKQPVSDRDWARGPADAPVTLVEFADYECKDCRASYPVVERVVQSYGDRVRFVFRPFPVVSKHPHAQQAALAAEAAGRQGRFWDMHRRLYEAGGALGDEDLIRYAEQTGLDVDRLRRDMQDEELARRIHEVKLMGVRSGVSGTPTLFINGRRYEGKTAPVQEDELRAAIEDALREVSSA
jgi:protein-disulfide isomerase